MVTDDIFFEVLTPKEHHQKKEDMRDILMQAIKMQAVYSEGKVRFVETSNATH